VESGPPSDGGGLQRGAELRIAVGARLDVPAGQSVALLSQPRDVAIDLLDLVAGLRPGRGVPAGSVAVDGVALGALRGPALDRYRASRGLLSPRFPLLPTRSVLDNVLAALPSGRADPRVRARAAELLLLTGATRLSAPGLAGPAAALTAEQRWRVLVARALLPAPRLVLSEDPAAGSHALGLDGRAATAIWDLLTDMHAMFGFTLLVAASHTATAIRCQRMVTLSGWTITDDELTSGDDPWTRGRIDRIG
jgi:phosphonate transport system ATP-binding protein